MRNLISLYNQLIPSQPTSIIKDLNNFDLQEYWFPIHGFSIGLSQDVDIKLLKEIGFGIGLHPSTILTIRAIKEYIDKTEISNFVDVGAGSGILSIFYYKYLQQSKKVSNKIFVYESQDESLKTMSRNFTFNNLDLSNVYINPELQVLGSVDDETLYAANMRPHEIYECKSILEKSQNLIVSGMMLKENLKFQHFIKKNSLIFDEWKCDILNKY